MLVQQLFKNINLEDPFFDSLKQDYKEFKDWFNKKAHQNESAFVFYIDQKIDGFMYLKVEEEELNDVTPNKPCKRRLKVGTLKINAHGTKLGERFIKKALDYLIYCNLDEIYLTVFDHHEGLIRLIEKYGFVKEVTKNTINGCEGGYFKRLTNKETHDIYKSYPVINTIANRKHLLAIYPQYHSRLLPDSILKTESSEKIIKDISHTNSIHKIYLCGMNHIASVNIGDILCVYRTSPEMGRANYLSVITSLCVIEEYKHISDFAVLEDFLRYALPFSIFTETELGDLYRTKKYPHIIRFTYNVALPKRIIRKDLIEKVGFSASSYWGSFEITNDEFLKICKLGEINENLIIN